MHRTGSQSGTALGASGTSRSGSGRSTPSGSSPGDRMANWAAMLVGQMVVATLLSGERYVGIVGAETAATDDLGVCLVSAQRLERDGASWAAGAPIPRLSIAGADLAELDASAVKVNSAQELEAVQHSQRRASQFRTDTEISANPAARGDGRTLQRWTGDEAALGAVDDGLSLESSASRGGAWDQFAANEARFGVKSNYEETLYTTKLDKSGKDFKARERQAERLAQEILQSTSTNEHVAEERNQRPAQEVDEENKYGAVVRDAPADAAPGPKAVASGKALTDEFHQFVSAERERLVVRKAELAKKEKQSRLADLKVWAQTFQLKTPVPADVASMKRTSSARGAAASPAQPAASSPAPPLEQARAKLAAMTLPAIPPYKGKDDKASTGTKLSAKASAFNPAAAAFTPAGAKAAPAPSVPSVPFFGTKVLKNRPSTSALRVGDEFRPHKSRPAGDAAKVSVWWSYTGRPFRQQVGASMYGAPPMNVPPMPLGVPGAPGTPGAPVMAMAYAPGMAPPGAMPSPHIPHGGTQSPRVPPQVVLPPGHAPPMPQQGYALMYPVQQYRVGVQPPPYMASPDMYRGGPPVAAMVGGAPPAMAAPPSGRPGSPPKRAPHGRAGHGARAQKKHGSDTKPPAT